MFWWEKIVGGTWKTLTFSELKSQLNWKKGLKSRSLISVQELKTLLNVLWKPETQQSRGDVIISTYASFPWKSQNRFYTFTGKSLFVKQHNKVTRPTAAVKTTICHKHQNNIRKVNEQRNETDPVFCWDGDGSASWNWWFELCLSVSKTTLDWTWV